MRAKPSERVAIPVNKPGYVEISGGKAIRLWVNPARRAPNGVMQISIEGATRRSGTVCFRFDVPKEPKEGEKWHYHAQLTNAPNGGPHIDVDTAPEQSMLESALAHLTPAKLGAIMAEAGVTGIHKRLREGPLSKARAEIKKMCDGERRPM